MFSQPKLYVAADALSDPVAVNPLPRAATPDELIFGLCQNVICAPDTSEFSATMLAVISAPELP
jgi:hypothetical protein